MMRSIVTKFMDYKFAQMERLAHELEELYMNTINEGLPLTDEQLEEACRKASKLTRMAALYIARPQVIKAIVTPEVQDEKTVATIRDITHDMFDEIDKRIQSL